MPNREPQSFPAPVAVLEHLTGPSRGTATWVGEGKLNVTLRRGGLLDVSSEEPESSGGILVARMRRSNGAYEIEAAGERQMWVNGRPFKTRRLEHHDTIEFSSVGPMSRLYLYKNGQPRQSGVADIFSDTLAYLRSSRKPLSQRLPKATIQVVRRLLLDTTLLFRISVIVSLIGLGLIVYQQGRINELLRQQIETGAAQLEGFSRLLARVKNESLAPSDLVKLREELAGRLATTTKRLSRLEHLSSATARVIAESRSSVLFLQGAYAFRERSTGRMLRHAVGAEGKPLVLPNGLPLLTFEGEGPVAERQFSGTGFVVGEEGLIVTSRHVAQPWISDANVTAMVGGVIEPVQLKFIAYLAGATEAIDVVLMHASNKSDLALLSAKMARLDEKGLRLARRTPEPGEEVVLIGYPTGMRSMLAQAGSDFVTKLQQEKVTDFWKVAERLAKAGRIVPLASGGIVGRVSDETIVYDAQTTHGGSGGPLLDIHGAVVAVNSAILPEYGGSNLGIPASELRRLIREVKAQ